MSAVAALRLYRPRGEISLYTDRFGCAIANDTTGSYEQVVVEGPAEADLDAQPRRQEADDA